MRKLRACLVALASFVLAGTFAGTASARRADKELQVTAAKIAQEYNDSHPDKVETVKTLHWIARTTANLKVTVEETGEEVKLNANKKVRVIQRDYHAMAGISEIQLAEGQTCYIANKYLTWVKPKATGASGDYSVTTKLAFVNGQRIVSSTDYMIWISLDKQRVNVFTGSNRNWTLIKTYKASSGAGESPTLDNSFKTTRYYHVKWKKQAVDSMTWFTSFYGSGIHRFVGPGKKNMGKKPISHSCVRVSNKNAKWIYENVPLHSRVFIW